MDLHANILGTFFLVTHYPLPTEYGPFRAEIEGTDEEINEELQIDQIDQIPCQYPSPGDSSQSRVTAAAEFSYFEPGERENDAQAARDLSISPILGAYYHYPSPDADIPPEFPRSVSIPPEGSENYMSLLQSLNQSLKKSQQEIFRQQEILNLPYIDDLNPETIPEFPALFQRFSTFPRPRPRALDFDTILSRNRRIRISCCGQDSRFIYLVYNLFAILSDFEEELQKELESNGGASVMGRRPEDEAAWKKLEEMNKRWLTLKKRSMEIRNRLETNVEHWRSLLASLKELITWGLEKTEELNIPENELDLKILQNHIDANRILRQQFENKRPIIETAILSGRNHVANELPGALNESRGHQAAKQLTKDIRTEVNRLSEIWSSLLSKSAKTQTYLEDSFTALLKSHSSVEPPWDQSFTQTRVPYYINHKTKKTQWDHPKMKETLEELKSFDSIRFSAYRTALKIRHVQKSIKLDKLELAKALDIFKVENKGDRLVDVPELISSLRELLPGNTTGIDLTLNWLLNVFDFQRSGLISNLSFKIGLILLCDGEIEDKFKSFFESVADVSTKLMDERGLGILLKDCLQIPKDLGEVAAFGGSINVQPSVRSCFEKLSTNRIKEQNFLDWTRQEPQCLVWVQVFHRIIKSESCQHFSTKCNCCKMTPILGLRYRCLKCFVNLCQNCFWSGQVVKQHKLTHPMHEYASEATSTDNLKDFGRALRNKFKSKKSLEKSRKLGYLPLTLRAKTPTMDTMDLGEISPEEPTEIEVEINSPAYTEEIQSSSFSPDSGEEHGLIAQYCRSIKNEHKKEVTKDPENPEEII